MMDNFFFKFVRLSVAMLCVLLSGIAAPAQPPARDPVVAQSLPIEAAWQALRAREGYAEFTDPQGAITRYQQFYEQQGFRSGVTAIEISNTIAQLYWQMLHDNAKALQIYDWALKTYDYLPQRASLLKERKWIVQAGDFAGSVDISPVQIGPPPEKGEAAPVKVLLGKDAASVASKVLLTPDTTALPSALSSVLPPAVPASQVAPVAVTPFPGVQINTPQISLPAAVAPSAVSPVNAWQVALRGYADQCRGGKITVETLFQNAGLTANDALEIISTPGIITGWKVDRGLRLALVEWVLQHSPASLASPEKLPPPVQFALAEYYDDHRDARAEALYQHVLAGEIPRGVWWSRIMTLYCLSDYYGSMGQYIEAAETKLKINEQTQDAFWTGNTYVEAARFYTLAGETEKAQELYKKAEKSAYGWAAGMALVDEGNALIAQGKYEEAIKVLSQPAPGQHADQMQVGLLSVLGYAYLQKGDVESARRVSQQAVDAYQQLKNPLQGEGMEDMVQSAQDRLQTIRVWNGKVFEIPLTTLLAHRDADGDYYARLYVHSFLKTIPVNIHFMNDAVNLVSFSLESQTRTSSGIMVSVYGIKYKLDKNSANIEARIIVPLSPDQVVKIHYLGDEQ
jgi:tetratricopeptide (TPR) repeat protein